MRTTALLIAASAALVSAQATYDEATGQWKCAKPNIAYCAGDSLKTDIIIRCNEAGIGQPGRCSNNLVGQPPVGAKPALCYQPDATSGAAACEKNCVVYNGDGSTFTLPAALCTPTSEPTTTITFVDPAPSSTILTQPSAEPTTTIIFTQPGEPRTTITFTNPSLPATSGEPTITTTYIHPSPHPEPTTTITYIDDWGVRCTTTYWQPGPRPTAPTTTTTITYIDDSGVTCTTTLWQPIPPPTTLRTTFVNPTQPASPTGTGSGNGGYNNGTCVTCQGGSGGQGGQGGQGGNAPPTPTKTPGELGPSSRPTGGASPSGVVTAGAAVNGIAGAAVLGMVLAHLL